MVFNPFGKNRLKISWERRKKNIIYVEAFFINDLNVKMAFFFPFKK